MRYLNSPKWNVLVIILGTIISSVIMMTSDFVEKGAGMATIIVMWIPAVLGIITLIFYLISRLLFKKFNWVITILGVVMVLTQSIKFHYFD